MARKFKGKGSKRFGKWEKICAICGVDLAVFYDVEEHIILHVLQQKEKINNIVNDYKNKKKSLAEMQDYYEYMLRNIFKKRGKI